MYQPNITTTERENEVLVDLLLTNKPSIVCFQNITPKLYIML